MGVQTGTQRRRCLRHPTDAGTGARLHDVVRARGRGVAARGRSPGVRGRGRLPLGADPAGPLPLHGTGRLRHLPDPARAEDGGRRPRAGARAARARVRPCVRRGPRSGRLLARGGASPRRRARAGGGSSAPLRRPVFRSSFLAAGGVICRAAPMVVHARLRDAHRLFVIRESSINPAASSYDDMTKSVPSLSTAAEAASAGLAAGRRGQNSGSCV